MYIFKTVPRRSTITSALLLVLSVAALADQPAATAPKKPAAAPNLAAFVKQHWIDRVMSFRKENIQKYTEKNVVLLGDSITEGFIVSKYFPDRHVLNRGIGADIIGNKLPESDTRILRRIDESVFDCNPSDVFLLIGINDLGMGHKPADIEAGDREFLEQIKKKAPDVHVHIQSLLPTRGKSYAKHNPNVLDVNNRLQKLAKEFDYDYIDLHSKMTDDKGELKKELTNDGLHLKPDGYKIWKAEIEKTMGWSN